MSIVHLNVEDNNGKKLATLHAHSQENGDVSWGLVAIEFPNGAIFKLGENYLDDKGTYICQMVVRIGPKVDRALIMFNNAGKPVHNMIPIRALADLDLWNHFASGSKQVEDHGLLATITTENDGADVVHTVEFEKLEGKMTIRKSPDGIFTMVFGEDKTALPDTVMHYCVITHTANVRWGNKSYYMTMDDPTNAATLIALGKKHAEFVLNTVVSQMKDEQE